MNTSLRRMALAATLAALAACTSPDQPPGVTTTPLTPTPGPAGATPTPGPSTSAEATPTATPAPAYYFQDTFDGPTLDTSKWTIYENGGLTRFADGRLELFTTGPSSTYPILLPTADNIPPEGPFYAEMRFQVLSQSIAMPAFFIDYFPPTKPNEAGLTEPLLYSTLFQGRWAAAMVKPAPGQGYRRTAGLTDGGFNTGSAHRLRVEWSEDATVRVIWDDTEWDSIKTTMPRPKRAWLGILYSAKPYPAQNWARFAVDQIETGKLVSPAPAAPAPTATPAL